jgi:hypothetical protein
MLGYHCGSSTLHLPLFAPVLQKGLHSKAAELESRCSSSEIMQYDPDSFDHKRGGFQLWRNNMVDHHILVEEIVGNRCSSQPERVQ